MPTISQSMPVIRSERNGRPLGSPPAT
jgi:hypothetical protein